MIVLGHMGFVKTSKKIVDVLVIKSASLLVTRKSDDRDSPYRKHINLIALKHSDCEKFLSETIFLHFFLHNKIFFTTNCLEHLFTSFPATI